MMGYTSITIAVTLSLGALLDAQALGEELKPFPYPCFDIALERTANITCIGRSCQPRCFGNCKRRCGSNEAIGFGYCGKGCQCCQPAILPCQHGARCGSGGKCRRITCPKGENPIGGRCGSSTNCICCAPTIGCNGKCSTRKGSGYCKDACNRGEERLGSCPGGKCSCCRRRVLQVCAGMCTLRGGQRGFCGTNCFQNPGSETDLSLFLIPAPATCNKGCNCCHIGIVPRQ